MYKEKLLLLSVLVYNYYLTPSTEKCNEQMYGKTLAASIGLQCKSSTHRGLIYLGLLYSGL